MEFILLIIIVVLLIVFNNTTNKKFDKLEKTIDKLNQRIRALQEKVVINKPSETKVETVFKQAPEVTEKVIQPILKEEIKVETPKKIVEEELPPIQKEESKEIKKVVRQQKVKAPKKSLYQQFKEKNPDLEKFIGENLINKIGVLILVLGISFFVKYAIDKDWINEPARVGIGVLCGSLIMAIAHKLKKNYASFSSVLIAGAISVFYFTIYIAFHEYQLFSQTVAFIIMVLITAFGTLVSVSYNRQELAVLALIGGFAVPFMVSTGEGNYKVLFTYIAILNIGILGISYFKKWRIATILAFVFTSVLYASWLFKETLNSDIPYTGALVFATVFYFIFSVTIVLNNLKNKGIFSKIEYFILIANTFFFFGMGMVILNDLESNYLGLFTLLLAVYNVFYAAILYRKFGLDKNAIYLLIGLALTFVTLTIPLQFNGNHITLFWAAEAVLLLWLSQKSKNNSFKLGAIIVQILAIISLLMDWKYYSYYVELPVLLNPLFIAGFVVSLSLFLTYWFLRKEQSFKIKKIAFNSKVYRTIALLSSLIIIYFTGLLETNYQAYQFLENKASALSLPVTYHFIFIAILLYVSNQFKKTIFTKGLLLISVFSAFLYIVKLYVLPINEIEENFIAQTNSNFAFYLHYLVLGSLVCFGNQIVKKYNVLLKVKSKQFKIFTWVFVFAIVYVLSNEVMVHSLFFMNNLDQAVFTRDFSTLDEYQKIYYTSKELDIDKIQIVKIGYPILWGVFSFAFLIIGIKKQWKTLRIIALALLGITVIKLFAYDIKNVSETGKIVAFILLGVLILIISFVYQKIKKLVVAETSENNKEDEKN